MASGNTTGLHCHRKQCCTNLSPVYLCLPCAARLVSFTEQTLVVLTSCSDPSFQRSHSEAGAVWPRRLPAVPTPWGRSEGWLVPRSPRKALPASPQRTCWPKAGETPNQGLPSPPPAPSPRFTQDSAFILVFLTAQLSFL